KLLWQRENAAWETWEPPQPDNVNSASIRPNRDVLHRRIQNQERLVIRDQINRHPSEAQLVVAFWEKGGFKFGPRLSGLELKALGMDEHGNLLVQAGGAPDQKATVTIHSGDARILGSRRSGVAPSVALTVWEAGSSRPSMIVQAGEETVIFHPPTATG